MHRSPVIIVGGGIAGLCCARVLNQSNIPWLILEASDRLGGRVRTEKFEDFQLDAGFQVLLTSYPEAVRALNFDRLKLGRFQPGALIWQKGKFRRFSDPWRVPKTALATALSPVGSLGDKLRVEKLRANLARGELDALLHQPETSTMQRLKEYGFSESIVESFFRPFLSGVFLESGLETSSRKFEYLFRLFSQGHAALPIGGMEQIARQLQEPLSRNQILLETPVVRLQDSSVVTAAGKEFQASKVVLACDAWHSAKLQGNPPPPPGYPAAVMYFASEQPPVVEPVLMLNGDDIGPINSLCVPSQVAAGYAPNERSLISVSPYLTFNRDGATLLPEISAVTEQLSRWFGTQVNGWRHLKTFLIENALPAQNKLNPSRFENDSPQCNNGLSRKPILCGDYTDVASIQGSMLSGRLAGEQVLKLLQLT